MAYQGNREEFAERQRRRRILRRVCGLCGEGAELMIAWSTQSVPVCDRCKQALEALQFDDRHCALNEVPVARLRPPVPAPRPAPPSDPGPIDDGIVQSIRSFIVEVWDWLMGR